jgi:hypothetical protein
MSNDFKRTVGSKAEVFHSTCLRTSGGLKKKDLMMTAKGRIVSRKKHAAGKKAIKRLFALGYKPQKGKFSLMRKGTAKGTAKSMAKTKSMGKAKGKKSKRSTRKRGGYNGSVTPFADMSGNPPPTMPPAPTSGFTGVPPAPK